MEKIDKLNKRIHLNSKNRCAFLGLLFAAGDTNRYVYPNFMQPN